MQRIPPLRDRQPDPEGFGSAAPIADRREMDEFRRS